MKNRKAVEVVLAKLQPHYHELYGFGISNGNGGWYGGMHSYEEFKQKIISIVGGSITTMGEMAIDSKYEMIVYAYKCFKETETVISFE